MTYNTGLQSTTSAYTYWSMPGSKSVTLTILNNGVDVAFGRTLGAGGPETANYPSADEYFPPGSLIRPDTFDAIRIKSHVPLAAAQYSISARLDAPSNMGASFSPTYITIDPTTGAVSADFSGHISASGVDLPEAPNTLIFSGVSAVDWKDQTTGQVREFITGGLQSTLHLLLLQSGPGLHGEKSSLTAFHTDSGSAAVGATADDGFGDSASVRIIDALGNSNFLQLSGASPSKLRFTAGQATVTWAGSAVSGVLAASTNLPSGATAITFGCATSAHGFASYGGIASNGIGTFSFYAVATGGIPPAGDTAVVTWMAAG